MRVDGGSETVDVGAYRFLAANSAGTTLVLERINGEQNEYLLYDVQSASTTLLFSSSEQLTLTVSRELDPQDGVGAIYFTTREDMGGGAPPLAPSSEDAGRTPEELYRYSMAEGKLRFVVQTSGVKEPRVSPDGHEYYWESEAVSAVFFESFEPHDVVGELQVYRYDSDESVVECMSCVSSFNPRPKLMSVFTPSEIEHTPNGVPTSSIASDNGNYVFFDTPATLLPNDTDEEKYAGTRNYFTEEHDFYFSPSSDVYEWRRNGIDGCGQLQGCLALISSGAGGLKNVLIGTTGSGRDVFFATHSQLVGTDTDGQGDVYDARIDGGFPEPSPPAPGCEASCQTPSAVSIDTTPASLSFAGPVEQQLAAPTMKSKVKPKLKRCRKGTVRRGKACVRKGVHTKHKRMGHGRSSTQGRGGR
jgi:hypothetical protein